METTALSVGKSVLNGALSYAKSGLAKEASLQLGVQRDQAFIADELEMMQSFMMEAHEERDNNKVVKTWVKQVRDTAYDVEDCLRDFSVRLQRQSWWRVPRTLLERRRVAKQMKVLRAKVEDVSQRNVRYRLIKGSDPKVTDTAGQSNLIAAAIFGVDNARRAAKQDNQRVDLVQLLNKEDEDLKVIAVWGTSGDIGQTTIIRAAYENPDVQSKFPGRAWVRVTQPFNPKGFVQSLVNQFHAVEGVENFLETEKTAQELTQEFNGHVNEKRCLIVLNDLSTVEEWDQIKKCFPNKKNGSRIVVSTSQIEVASLCAGQESQASELKQLSAEQTLYAFYDKGSRNGKGSEKPASSSDTAISSPKNYTVALGEITDDESKDADGKKVVTKSLACITTGMDSVKPASSSDMATTSRNDQAVALGEITEDESKDADGNKVTKTLTRTRTGAGASEESQLIGRQKEILEVIDLISNEDSQQGQVISVCGMGGLGKTTLVHGVYYSPKLSDKFEKRVFVTVMRPFDPAEHLRRLIVGLREGSSTKEELLGSSVSNKRRSFATMGVEDLTKEMVKLLETKSCLIVLDDLSSTTEWDLIIPKLPRMKTSRIIVTTRNENIAKHCIGSGKHGTVHNLKVLEPEDALHLFNEKMEFVNQPVEEPEKSLRDYASPRCEDIKVQESDSKLEATKYEIKSKIMKMVAENPFEGMVTENPYRHIRDFTTICNTVRQEGVPDEWFKWNLFPYSLAGKAKTWYSVASFEVEGNWNKLTKKFCEKFFPMSKVQHLRRQVINFMQGEEEGIDQAWERFNELIEQGPKLGFTGDVLLHTFFFSLTPSCMRHVEMCAGGDLMEKTLTEAAQLLQKVSKAAAMRRDWETRLAEEPEFNSRKKKLADFSKEATPEVTKEEPIMEKLEQEHIKSRTTPNVDFAAPNETNKRSMSSAKPLREFEPMDWVPIDYGEVFDKRRPFPNQKGMARALEVDFPPEKKAENSYDLETTGEIFEKLFGDDVVDPEHIAEVKRIMGIKPEASPYTRLAEIYSIGSEEEEKMTPHLSCEINGVQCKALCDIGAQVFGEARDFIDQKNPELLKEAKQILKKCGGLPLAIVVIGGFLANRPKTRSEWRKLNENISAELEMNPELGMIRTVLEKSYDGLPYELKSCFLYLSIFPEDHTISQRRLVHRWAAEGYTSERHGKSANAIAENYFTELKNRSMILPFQQSVCSRKSTDSCKVHDLIRDIAISKSMEENLVLRLEEGYGLSTHGTIRHLAISSNWKGDQNEFGSIVDLSRIRSLTMFGNFRPFYISDKMRLLRVLDLEHISDLRYHQLDHIWKLLHLKYLSLRGCRGVDLLPDSLGNLRQLEVLDIRGTSVEALPYAIIKLRKLQYIHAGRKLDYVKGEKSSLASRCLWGLGHCATCCVPLLSVINGPPHKALTRRDACTFACCVKFPAVMTGVYEERGPTIPGGTRKLKDLHTLREVNVGRGSAVLQDIKMLTGLRKLGVAGINWKNGLAFCAAISNLSRLESLSVSSAGKPGLRGCLDDISPPPENLQCLKLYGNLETLPEWIKELPHLMKLKLVSTRLLEHDAAMEFLGKLSKLEILSLSWQSFQGKELRFRSQQTGRAFGSLRVLMLATIWNIKSVKFEEGIMPKLERLQVTGEVDDEIGFSGLEFLQSINEVQLSVYFPRDWGRLRAARDSEIWDKIQEEERRKKGELKKKIQEQLARNKNEPILTVD